MHQKTLVEHWREGLAIVEENKQRGRPEFPTGLNFLDNITGGMRRGEIWIVSGKTGSGKCLSWGTLVLMHNGEIKKVEDIVNGDVIMGDDSTPRIVSGCISGIDKLYEIIPTKGKSYIVNSNHILSLKKTGDWKIDKKIKGKVVKHTLLPKGKVIDISIGDYLKQNKFFKHRHKGFRVPIKWKKKKITLDPYFLGLWLGDGDSDSPRISNIDKEIEEYLRNYAKKLNLSFSKKQDKRTGCYYYTIIRNNGRCKNKILEELRRLKLSNNKHIPDNYKINSRSIRLRLLAGLIDSDGHCHSGIYEYVTKLPRLRDDVLFLCKSLGFAAYSSVKIVNDKEYYRINISGNLSCIPCKILRKKCPKRKQKKDVLVTGIKVKELGIGAYCGFELNGNGRFVLGDFTVTHNTSLALQLARSFADSKNHAVLFLSLEMRGWELCLRMYSELHGVNYFDLIQGRTEIPPALGNTFENYINDIDFEVMERGYNFDEVVKTINEYYKTKKPDIIFLDFIQLIDWKKFGDERKALMEYIRKIKEMANKYNIGFVVVSQIRRIPSGADYNREPNLHDLFGSGCVYGNSIIEGKKIKDIYKNQEYFPIKSYNKLNNKIEYIIPSRIINTGQLHCYRIKTKSGKEIILSKDTKLLKNNKWIKTKKLKVGNRIFIE